MNKTLWLPAIAVAAAGLASAEVPPTIAKQLINIGRGVCVPETTQIYRPLHAGPPYKGVTIARDISFGPDPMNVLDVFSAEKGGGSRPVLIYVSGGAGNKLANGPEGVFYDNIMLWATKNGMVGVNMQRRAGQAWDDPAKDIAKVVQWVSQNISKYKGNPGRVFIWAQSAGNVPTSTYIGHPEFYGPKGVGVKGVVFMSAPNFNILPATPPPVQAGAGGGFGACGQPDGGPAPAAQAKGKGKGGAPGGPGGNAKAGGGGGKGKQAQPDAATQLARSNLPGMVKSKVPFLISVAELDPPNIITFAQTLRDELTKAGAKPTFMEFKDHSHISEVMSPDTADTSVTGPILKWMKSVK
jgi:triacylglycerol lipase